MTEEQVFDLRRRIAAGEEITEEELREAVKVMSQQRSAKQNKPKPAKVTESELDDLLSMIE